MADDWDLFDDVSEGEEWDASDEWDAADDPGGPWFTAADLDDDPDEELDDEGPGDAEWADHAALDVEGSGDGGLPVGRYGRDEAQERGMIDPWDAGTAAAIAGWLLDRQAEQIVEGVRAAVAHAPAQAAHAPAPAGLASQGRALPHRKPRLPIDWDAVPLHIGDRLDSSRLAVTIAVRLGANHPLALDAAPVAAAGPVASRPGLDWSALSFTVAVTRIVPELPVWVMFDDRADGFRAADLRTGFADEGPAGRAYRFVATPEDAVEAVEWGLGRYRLRLSDFRWAGGF